MNTEKSTGVAEPVRTMELTALHCPWCGQALDWSGDK